MDAGIAGWYIQPAPGVGHRTRGEVSRDAITAASLSAGLKTRSAQVCAGTFGSSSTYVDLKVVAQWPRLATTESDRLSGRREGIN